MSEADAMQPGIDCGEHLGLARTVTVRIYSRWHHTGMDRDDLFQVVYLFMERCATRYDPTRINPRSGKPYAWSSYFVTASMRSEPSLVEEALGYKRTREQRGIRFHRSLIPLDVRVEGKHPLHERVAATPPDADGTAAEAAREIERVVEGMNPRQRDVYRLRTVGGHSLAKTGAQMELSRERVRQIEAEVLREIRRAVSHGECPHVRDWIEDAG